MPVEVFLHLGFRNSRKACDNISLVLFKGFSNAFDIHMKLTYRWWNKSENYISKECLSIQQLNMHSFSRIFLRTSNIFMWVQAEFTRGFKTIIDKKI